VGALAFLDFDGDGLLDIFFVNGGETPRGKSSSPVRNALYRNLGNGKFEKPSCESWGRSYRFLRDGRGSGGLLIMTVFPISTLPGPLQRIVSQQSRWNLHGRNRASRRKKRGTLGGKRGLVRFRPGWPSGPGWLQTTPNFSFADEKKCEIGVCGHIARKLLISECHSTFSQ